MMHLSWFLSQHRSLAKKKNEFHLKLLQICLLAFFPSGQDRHLCWTHTHTCSFSETKGLENCGFYICRPPHKVSCRLKMWCCPSSNPNLNPPKSRVTIVENVPVQSDGWNKWPAWQNVCVSSRTRWTTTIKLIQIISIQRWNPALIWQECRLHL